MFVAQKVHYVEVHCIVLYLQQVQKTTIRFQIQYTLSTRTLTHVGVDVNPIMESTPGKLGSDVIAASVFQTTLALPLILIGTEVCVIDSASEFTNSTCTFGESFCNTWMLWESSCACFGSNKPTQLTEWPHVIAKTCQQPLPLISLSAYKKISENRVDYCPGVCLLFGRTVPCTCIAKSEKEKVPQNPHCLHHTRFTIQGRMHRRHINLTLD